MEVLRVELKVDSNDFTITTTDYNFLEYNDPKLKDTEFYYDESYKNNYLVTNSTGIVVEAVGIGTAFRKHHFKDTETIIGYCSKFQFDVWIYEAKLTLIEVVKSKIDYYSGFESLQHIKKEANELRKKITTLYNSLF